MGRKADCPRCDGSGLVSLWCTPRARPFDAREAAVGCVALVPCRSCGGRGWRNEASRFRL